MKEARCPVQHCVLISQQRVIVGEAESQINLFEWQCGADRMPSERADVLARTVERLEGPPSPGARQESTGGRTRTYDTRIMIPLL